MTNYSLNFLCATIAELFVLAKWPIQLVTRLNHVYAEISSISFVTSHYIHFGGKINRTKLRYNSLRAFGDNKL